MSALAALNKLAKWRIVLAGWQLGARPIGDPESDAVGDHRELSLILRAEVDALAGLLMTKGVFTHDEWEEALTQAATLLDSDLQHRFPGFSATLEGVVMSNEAARTLKHWQRRR